MTSAFKTYAVPGSACTPMVPYGSSHHKRSTSGDSTTSTLSSSSTSPNIALPLQERRGIISPLSLSDLPAGAKIPESQSHTGRGGIDQTHGPRRRRALPVPMTVFDSAPVMGGAGAKISSARDFGMGEDGWTVVAL